MSNSKVRRRTLKESYDKEVIVERIHDSITKRLIAESAATTLMEALDKSDFENASEVLKKLSLVKNAADKYGLGHMSDSIKKASDDLNSFTGGGWGAFLKKGYDVIAKKIGGTAAQKNPIVKCSLLLSVIEDGFSKVPQIMDNVGIKKDSETTISDADDENAIKNVGKLFSKAFVPQGLYAKLQGLFGSGIPYIDDKGQFVSELMSIPVKNLVSFSIEASKTKVAAKTAEAVKDVAQAPKEEKTGETTADPNADIDSGERRNAAVMKMNLDKKGRNEVLRAMKNGILKVGDKVK